MSEYHGGTDPAHLFSTDGDALKERQNIDVVIVTAELVDDGRQTKTAAGVVGVKASREADSTTLLLRCPATAHTNQQYNTQRYS